MTYYGNVNPELLGWMPLDARRVLELGCGNGALAAVYRERNPAVHYTAVEVHGPSADVAEARVDRLLREDFETLADEAVSGGERFDAIVLGDVLEHLTDPAAVLRRLRGMLADDGHLVVSVPNIGHWTAFFHLMHGRWPAEDSGLFDRTHLRFFTLPSLIDTLKAAGFAVVKGRPRNFPLDRDKAEQWVPKLADFAESMGIDRPTFLARASALQYVVVAAKAERETAPRLRLAVSALAPRLMEVRARLPTEQLQSIPDIVVSYAEKDIVLPSAGQEPRILIVQRAGPRPQEQWTGLLATAISRGWLIVAEWDDHPDLVARVLGWGPELDRWRVIEQTHAVQTSTPALRDAFLAHHREVAFFPNTAFALPPLPEPRDRPASIFYGALNRGAHAADIAASLTPAIAAHPGMTFEVVHDRAVFEALPTERKRFHETLPYEVYLTVLAGCDIALLPLEGKPEELTKSDLKYVEAASRGVAVIAAPAVYAATVRDGETGLIAARREDWATALARLAADPGERRRIAGNAWEDVRANRMFARQIPDRLAWYGSLWRRREELQRTLIARTPGLAERLAAMAQPAAG